jgi:hypothetical protein
MTGGFTQLLVYRFGPRAEFEGRLVGALQRIESGGVLRVRDVVFVRSDAETGELEAVTVRGDGTGGAVGSLIGFRLDAAERRRATRRALDGDRGPAVRALAEALGPGESIAAVLVEHLWRRALEDAVARTGGSPVVSEFVEATSFADARELFEGRQLGAGPRQADG